jgi:MFS family permease
MNMASAAKISEKGRALGLISLGVFLASSTWFSGTAAAPALRKLWSLTEVQAAGLTVSVQLGFIVGTFLYALFNLSDVFDPRGVFLASSAAGAVLNSCFAMLARDLESALAFRFLTGVTLAGVYPVGLKLVAQWFRKDLGWALGILVGGLTLGTALPYAFSAFGSGLDPRLIAAASSGLAAIGGGIVFFGLGKGPFLRETARFEIRAAARVFRDRAFRLQALGYFGHMWELYALWALAGSFLGGSLAGRRLGEPKAVSLLMFAVVGIGAAGCWVGGLISRRVGERPVALAALGVSAACCALAGLFFGSPPALFVPFMLLWGAAAVADSPQFSSLAAKTCPPEYTGTALTIQNGIGFAVTVVSIQLLAWLGQKFGWRWALAALAIGPALGALAVLRAGRPLNRRGWRDLV